MLWKGILLSLHLGPYMACVSLIYEIEISRAMFVYPLSGILWHNLCCFILFSILTSECSSHASHGHWNASLWGAIQPWNLQLSQSSFIYNYSYSLFSPSHLLPQLETLTLNSHFTKINTSCHIPFSPSLNWTVSCCSQTAWIPKPTANYIPSDLYNKLLFCLTKWKHPGSPNIFFVRTNVPHPEASTLLLFLHLTTSFLKLSTPLTPWFFFTLKFFTYFKLLTIFLDVFFFFGS